MIRNLKTLGLALVAVFAFSAVVASAASAENGQLTSDGPVTLTGTETGTLFQNSLTAFGQKVSCDGSTYTGHKLLTHEETTKEVKHQLIEPPTSTVTITPHYISCKAHVSIFTFAATVDMNGCDYEFHLETTTGEGDTYGVLATVKCPAGKHIVVTVFDNHGANELKCTITITENEKGYKGAHVTDTTKGDLNITGTIKGIEAHREGGFGCAKETDKEGELHIDVTVKGHDKLKEPTDIGIWHP